MDASQQRARIPSFPASASPRHPLSESANTSFAFLVHSQDTLPRNLPPSVDNKPLARQRRRRTSPEDQAILEEEFLRDSKPDKTARARIVERVALGEKEVQIWFQNRRQNSRRKSRPLLPHEILSHLQSVRGVAPESSSLSPEFHTSVSPLEGATALPASTGIRSAAGSFSSSSVQAAPAIAVAEKSQYMPMLSTEVSNKIAPAEQDETTNVSLKNTLGRSNEVVLPSLRELTEPLCGQPNSALKLAAIITNTSVADAGSVQESDFVKEETVESMIQSIDAAEGETPGTLKRTRSKVRLSMTSDGGAKIITGDELSPSPPRSQPAPGSSSVARSGLRRSYSATGLNELSGTGQSNGSNVGLRRVPSGRSRDSRAWEFWCDNDVRNELVKKADQEQTGSAADAISLIRSGSRGPLTPNLNKGNALLMRHASVKRAKTEGLAQPKPLLGRAKSSVARLQGASVHGSLLAKGNDPDRNAKPSNGTSGTVIGSSGDSDKENWEPGIQALGNAQRGLLHRGPAGHRRPILEERREVPSRTNSLSFILNNYQGVKEGRERGLERDDPEKDEEIASFMRTGRKSGTPSSPAADDDMDCIQGLLSLSQGAWR